MQFLNYLAISVIAYLGVLVGYLFLVLAPEEKQPGMKYFSRISSVLALSAAFLAIYLSFRNPIILSLSAIFILLLIFYRKHLIHVSYIFFSVIFCLLSESAIAFSIISIIIFAYGLTSGAIIFDPREKRKSLMKCLSLSYFIIIASFLRTFL